MLIDLEPEENRLPELDLLREQRTILLEQINAATKLLTEIDERIAEFERSRRASSVVAAADGDSKALPESSAKRREESIRV